MVSDIHGQKIKTTRPMTAKEIRDEGWYEGTTVIVLENGVKLYASQDSEGNGSGALFGSRPDGSQFALC
jgi:hypothetical protein